MWVGFEAIIALYNILNFILWCVYLNGIFHRDAVFPRVCMLSHFHGVWLFATPWTVACQLLFPWDSPGKNTVVGCHALL